MQMGFVAGGRHQDGAFHLGKAQSLEMRPNSGLYPAPRDQQGATVGMGLAFLCFVPLAGTAGRATPALLVMAIMAVFAVSELLLSPIGLSVTTKLAPEAFRAQMMALYFFSVGLGTAMSGVLAGYYDPSREFAYPTMGFAVSRGRRFRMPTAGPRRATYGMWLTRRHTR